VWVVCGMEMEFKMRGGRGKEDVEGETWTRKVFLFLYFSFLFFGVGHVIWRNDRAWQLKRLPKVPDMNK